MTRAPRPPSFTKAQRFEVATDHGAMVMCQICEFLIFVRDMEIDHELAVIDGGAHGRLNWRPVCFSCHRIKSAREHRNNAKCKRVAKKRGGHLDRMASRKGGEILDIPVKPELGANPDRRTRHSGEQKPKRKIQGGRPLRGRVSPEWPSRPIPSRQFQKRPEV